MKKAAAFLLAVFLIFSIIGCNAQTQEPVLSPTPEVTQNPTPTPEPTPEPINPQQLALSYCENLQDNRMIEWADLLAMVDNGENPYILSIRHNDAYNTGHIKGAYNLAYPETLAAQMRKLPTDETVYVYCDTGEVSSQVVAIFNMIGIDSVSVKSGYRGH